ncbi:MAG: ABC transporter permease [Acidobacteria bacterium]|nr:ABC transporter permease [Acidobacteriota bacterium]
MNNLLLDLRYALRLLLKNPGFTAVAVFSLALGIGASTTTFSWVQSVLLNPLSGVKNGSEIGSLESVTPSGETIDSSYLDYRDFRDNLKLCAGVVVHRERPFSLSLSEDQQAERVWGEFVSGNYFDVLGVRPAVGRFFTKEEQEEKPGAHAVVVLSAKIWKSRFGGDAGAMGRVIQINRQPFTVIGVASPEFEGTVVGLSFDLFIPIQMQRALMGGDNWLDNRQNRPLHIMARMQPGVSFEQARAEVQTVARRLAMSNPDDNQGIGATIVPIRNARYGAQSVLSSLLEILMAAGCLVLLIVCANVANLLLAKATVRERELGVRLALGASHTRLFRQVLTESLLLSLIGGAFGVLLAFWMGDSLKLLLPVSGLPIASFSRIDSGVLGYAILLCFVASVLFGSAPAIHALRQNVQESLRSGGRAMTSGSGSRVVHRILVGAEMALALVAMAGAGLFVQSFERARQSETGFDSRNVFLAGFNLSASNYTREQGLQFYRQLRERVSAIPGVQAVSFADNVPLGLEKGSWETLEVDGYVPAPNENMKIYRNPVAPGYFDLMRIPITSGRDFTAADDRKTQLVMIVNEAFARRFFAGREAIGRKVHGWGEDLTVVGVVKDFKIWSRSEAPQPFFFVAVEQFYSPSTGLALHARTAGPPEQILSAVRQQVRELDPSVAIQASTSLEEYIGGSTFVYKAAASVLSAMGVLSLLLASLGVYGVLAYFISQRTHEIGIRMALGAQPTDILRLMIGQGMALTFAGVAAGLVAALVFARFVRSLLFGVSANDPFTFVSVAGLLTGVALLACWIPSRRAARVDPLVALRYE